jgi:hypothetical protein
VTEFDKRIVLEHTTGKFKGIHSICGLRSDAPDPLPEFTPDVDMHDHTGPVSLVEVKRTYVLYREIYKPAKMVGRAQPDAPFDRSQR